jgi:hypothetical protein
MTRVLFVGQKPETVDFSDPAIPPGFDAREVGFTAQKPRGGAPRLASGDPNYLLYAGSTVAPWSGSVISIRLMAGIP